MWMWQWKLSLFELFPLHTTLLVSHFLFHSLFFSPSSHASSLAPFFFIYYSFFFVFFLLLVLMFVSFLRGRRWTPEEDWHGTQDGKSCCWWEEEGCYGQGREQHFFSQQCWTSSRVWCFSFDSTRNKPCDHWSSEAWASPSSFHLQPFGL